MKREVGEKKEIFMKALERNGITSTGSIATQYYNPPFTIPFLRRNEVSIQIKMEK